MAQITVEVYAGAVVVRQAGKVIGRFGRDETGTATINTDQHPDAETPDPERWDPFTVADTFLHGKPVDEPGVTTYRNNLYTVAVTDAPDGITWLSIKSNDRHWRHDWRHLQRIKNELVGPEREACELYPAESRLVDESNQFHLWALPEGQQFAFGYQERSVLTDLTGTGAAQRPLEVTA